MGGREPGGAGRVGASIAIAEQHPDAITIVPVTIVVLIARPPKMPPCYPHRLSPPAGTLMLTASLLLLARIGAEPSGLEMMQVRCTPPPYEALRVKRLPGVAAT